MHDTVIRGGTIVDGSGQPAFCGDVALDDGRITSVGGRAGPGRREIHAEGMLVTPGWVDVHTHYDGQATWDPILAPSSWLKSSGAPAFAGMSDFVAGIAEQLDVGSELGGQGAPEIAAFFEAPDWLAGE